MAGERLSLVVFSGGFDRVHYALAMAAAAAAIGRPVTLLFAGRSLPTLIEGEATPGWHGLDAADDGSPPVLRDGALVARGVGGLEEMLTACAALEVTVMVCEMGLRALGLPPDIALRADVPHRIGGLVGFLAAAEGGSLLFV